MTDSGLTAYTTAIVTRNRPGILSLCLPSHIAQTRPPEKIIIVDSSDDCTVNIQDVASIREGTPIPIEYIKSEPGTSLQRNIALRRVASEVVFFPDDDSILYPHAAQKMMEIYDRDKDGYIGGVCGREENRPPEKMRASISSTFRMNRKDKIRQKLAASFHNAEQRYLPDPMKIMAKRFQKPLPEVPWLHQFHATKVEWMTGFRMSFRTDVLRQFGFNETLGRYALYEDCDASLQTLKAGKHIVCALDAPIYHHRSPEKRDNGLKMGTMRVLNRAYAVMRAGGNDRSMKSAIRRFSMWQIAQFAPQSTDRYGRGRLRGAWRAYKCLPSILAADEASIDKRYVEALRKCLL